MRKYPLSLEIPGHNYSICAYELFVPEVSPFLLKDISITRMKCERNTTHSMSDLCLEAWSYGYNTTENCIPSYMEGVTGMLAGIWHVFNA